jgi:hypothetical protein
MIIDTKTGKPMEAATIARCYELKIAIAMAGKSKNKPAYKRLWNRTPRTIARENMMMEIIDREPVSYKQLESELGINYTSLKNYGHSLRGQGRAHLVISRKSGVPALWHPTAGAAL